MKIIKEIHMKLLSVIALVLFASTSISFAQEEGAATAPTAESAPAADHAVHAKKHQTKAKKAKKMKKQKAAH